MNSDKHYICAEVSEKLSNMSKKSLKTPKG